MEMEQQDITAPMKDNQTWNSCSECSKNWQDTVPTPGLLHRTRLCEKCKKKNSYFCEKCNEWFKLPYYCIHKYNPDAPSLKGKE